MKHFLALVILLCAHFSFAQVLLIPSSDRNYDLYHANCQKPGYICTMNFQLEKLQKEETPQFDLLLEELDYSSKDFRDGLTDRILKLIKSEMISIEQVEILLKLIEQALLFTDAKKLKPLQAIAKQLQESLRVVHSDELKELPSEFAVVFKKALPLKARRQFQTSLIKIKTDIIGFNHATSSSEFLATGDCKNESLHSSVQNLKWQMDRETSCDFAEQFGRASSSTSDFVSKNKTSLITVGIVAIGAALLLNNYEVEFSF